MSQYAGSEWIACMFDITPSPLGRRVADILGHVWQGIYHIKIDYLQRVDWKNSHHISIKICGGLATFDANQLTTLVILCHDAAIRLEISSAKLKFRDEDGNKCVVPALELLFHQRQREGRLYERHPTMEEAITKARGAWERDRGPMTVEAKAS